MATFSNLLLVAFQIWCVNAGVKHKIRPGQEDIIIFPEQTLSVGNRQGTDAAPPAVPTECLKKTFCTIKPKNYPQEQFNKMFANKKLAPPPTLVVEDFGNRNWNEEDNCKTLVTYEPIYMVKSRVGEWRNVVQAPEQHYEQKVRMESCIQPEAPCFQVFSSIPDYTPFCKQKYNTWEILVAKPDGGTEKIKSELPSCCSCFYRPVDLKNL